MRALILNDSKLRVDELPDPEPGEGQVLVKTLSAGICASDLHLADHGEALADWSRRFGGPFASLDTRSDFVLGHEFCCEILDFGPGTERKLSTGTRVTSAPTLFGPGGRFDVLGYSNTYPGGYAQQMLLSESLLHAVPESVPSDVAALSEPLSVGMQYARIGRPAENDVPLVVGCGMIGLSLIAGLKRRGVSPIVASDYSAERRALALAAGADEVNDPAAEPAMRAWARAAKAKKRAGALLYEVVGVPGVLQSIVEAAPWSARIVVAGVCLEPDTLWTAAAHTKGMNIQFGGNPVPEDFDDSYDAIESGSVDVASWITDTCGLADSPAGFERAKNPHARARILIRPNE